MNSVRLVESADLQAKPSFCTPHDLSAYRFYFFSPRRLKLFEKRALGAGTFVAARIARDRHLAWERTKIYRSGT
jgi:hypothetical protein